MKLTSFFCLTFLALSWNTFGETKSPSSDLATLIFKDQTSLVGEILALDPKKGELRFTSPDLEGEVTLKTAQLLEINLAKKDLTTEEKADHYAIATSKPRFDKRPKDSLRGKLQAIDETHITLETNYAGPLQLRREFIGDLTIFANSPSVYYGPRKLNNWTVSSGNITESWDFKDNALVSKRPQGIAREVKIPEQAKISFTISWKNIPAFQFAFLSNEGSTKLPPVSYMCSFSHNSSITLTRNGPNNARREIFNHLRHSLIRSGVEKATFDFYLDRTPDGKNGLFIGGALFGSWTGTDDRNGMGDWIHFIPQTQSPISISDISVTAWDGLLPTGQDTTKPLEHESLQNLDGEIITLSNGDILVGSIEKVAENLLETKTIYGNMQIPIRRVSGIDVAGKEKNSPQPKLARHDIRAWFKQGGYLHIDLVSMDETTIHGKSQVFGEATFQRAAFSRLEFNIWRRQLDLIRYGTPTP